MAARKRLLAVVLAGAVLTACGGGGEEGATPATSDPETAAQDTPSETAAQDTPSETAAEDTPSETAAQDAPSEAAADGSAMGGPVTVENCGRQLTFDEPPQRAVAIQHNTTEMLLALGLEDRLAGTAYVDGEILPEYRAAYEAVPSVSEEIPSQEALLGVEPDFVIAGFGSILSETGVGTPEELAELGVPAMLVSTSCPDREGAPTLEDVYADLRTLGQIFGVEERAEEVVAGMEATVAEVATGLEGVEEQPRVLVYDSGDDPAFVFGGASLADELVDLAGGENVFTDLADGFVEVNWEQAIERDPEAIVLIDAVYSSAEDKRARLSQPPLSSMTAVRDQRYVTVLSTDVVPSVRNDELVADLAEVLHPDALGG